MASRPSSVRFKHPATSQGLDHTKLSTASDLEGLERTSTRHESISKRVHLPKSQTPCRSSRPVSMIVENKRASTPAIPEFLSASYMTGSSSISRSSSSRSSASSTQSITRRYSMRQLLGNTKTTPAGTPAGAGSDAVLASVVPIKPSPPSRRSRIFRFFGLHHVQGPVIDSNDFLAPGLHLGAEDRVVLDRLDLKVLRKSR